MALLTTTGESLPVSLTPVSDDGRNLPGDPWSYLESERFLVPEDADSHAVEYIVPATNSSEPGESVNLSIDLMSAESGMPVLTLASMDATTITSGVESRAGIRTTLAPFAGSPGALYVGGVVTGLDIARPLMQVN